MCSSCDFFWSMSVVITALLMSGLMYPLPKEIRRRGLEIKRRALELKSLGMSIQKVRRMMQARDDPIDLLCLHAFGKCCWYYLNLCNGHLIITMIFINGIDIMAKKILGFIDLSALDLFYMLPLLTGLAFWLTSKDPTMSLPKIISRTKTLPLWRDVKHSAFEDADHHTYVDLKDKWKTLFHTAKISPQQRRGEPVPQELLNRVLNAHGYWSKQHMETLALPKQESVLLL